MNNLFDLLGKDNVIGNFIEMARRSQEYKKLTKRCFRDRADYEKFKNVCISLAGNLNTIEEALVIGKFLDPIWVAATHSFWEATNSPDFPVYAIKKDLLNDFMLSDPPTQVWGIRKMFSRALFMFPTGMIKTPDNLELNWIFVDFLEPYEDMSIGEYGNFINQKVGRNIKHNITNYEGIDSFRVRWATQVELQFIYSSTKKIPAPDDDNPCPGFQSFDGDEITEKAFADKITGLIFQILIYMLRSKSEIEAENPVSDLSKRAKSQRRIDPKLPREFIMVGNDYSCVSTPKGGTHASPSLHLRRGHYRSLPWRDENNKVWVRPCYVGN